MGEEGSRGEDEGRLEVTEDAAGGVPSDRSLAGRIGIEFVPVKQDVGEDPGGVLRRAHEQMQRRLVIVQFCDAVSFTQSAFASREGWELPEMRAPL